jgi:hypothetical protein
MLDVGFADTEAVVVEFKPFDGDHEKLLAVIGETVGDNIADVPAQTVALFITILGETVFEITRTLPVVVQTLPVLVKVNV